MQCALKYTFVFISLVTFVSCKKDKLDTRNSEFQNIYNDLIGPGNKQDISFDAVVHSYTFTLSENKTLTAIGYQSHPNLSNTPYMIEIRKNTDSSIVYSSEHQFSSTDISYVSPTSPVNLQSGVSYTISRIQINYTQYVTDRVGHLVPTEESDYPLSFGVLTITETNFGDQVEYQNSSKYHSLPRIDIELQ
ncbi:MAG: hypothetical protein JNJ99_07050 [Crocinitomicaceae bacterium]|nr:hypothetical protein [Crocinitomicaceae bacterium]